jgi:ribonuclease Y
MASKFFLLLIIFFCLLIGLLIGYLIREIIARKFITGAEVKAKKILQEAKNKEQEILLAAREKAIKLIDEAKQEEERRRQEIIQEKKRLENREALFDKKLLELEERQSKLSEKVNQVEALKTEIQKLKEEEIKKLEAITGLTRDQAREELFRLLEQESKEALISRLHKIENQGREELERKAKMMLVNVIERIAISQAGETTTTTIDLPSDEMKGRIIGKEGRNIKTIEKLTGTEIIVDETPQVITISGFSPIRRQVAKRALEKLIADGRIHPARIEEAVEEAKHDLAVDIKKAGEDALFELGITGLDPKLVSILGRLKYRTSYGQNVLEHSKEVAIIAGLLAEELGADVGIAKKGGLLHDIGKALDHDIPGTHTELGYQLMKKFGLPEEIAYLAIAHHEDAPKTLEGIIIKVADAISGSRPGARRESLEEYIKRLEDLERIATSFKGVEKAYAIQAGREVRAFVIPTEVDDLGAYELAKNIAKKIEEELQYPGEIKVNVIRETRVTEYAR